MLREVRLVIIIATRTRMKWNLRRGRVVSIPTLYLGGLGFKSGLWGDFSPIYFSCFFVPPDKFGTSTSNETTKASFDTFTLFRFSSLLNASYSELLYVEWMFIPPIV
jgi:hypothetical protein